MYNAYEAFSRIYNMLDHNSTIHKSTKIKITPNILTDYRPLKIELPMKVEKNPPTLKDK